MQQAEKQANQPPRRALWFTREALQDAFRHGGCVVCQAVATTERKSIWSFLYEGMMSPQVRQDFLAGGGFCPRHFGMAKEIEEEAWQTGGIGVAILCAQLVRQAARALPPPPEEKTATRRLGLRKRSDPRPFAAGHACLFCRENSRKEQGLLETLEELSEEPEYAEALRGHPLCLRHSQQALGEWRSPERREWLRELVLRQASELIRDLNSFIEKHDYNRRHEVLGREADAVQRALRLLAGPEAVAEERRKQRHENPGHLRPAR